MGIDCIAFDTRMEKGRKHLLTAITAATSRTHSSRKCSHLAHLPTHLPTYLCTKQIANQVPSFQLIPSPSIRVLLESPDRNRPLLSRLHLDPIPSLRLKHYTHTRTHACMYMYSYIQYSSTPCGAPNPTSPPSAPPRMRAGGCSRTGAGRDGGSMEGGGG